MPEGPALTWVTLRGHRLERYLHVYPDVEERLASLTRECGAQVLSGRRVGLEKESLRVGRDGQIAASDHPVALGSALCNGTVTTDFSESLLEMVTPPCASAREAVEYLTDVHRFILPRLADDEHLWNASMPCILRGAESIRIGDYGSSNNGLMKHAYRRGLALRYGKRMQAIAGVHFNFSLPEDCWDRWLHLHTHVRPAGTPLPGLPAGQGSPCGAEQQEWGASTCGYFHMTRNLLRIGWLVPYLFGASPAICRSFLQSDADVDLDTYHKTTRFAPHGTSLRMGDIGYQYRQDGAIDLSVRHDDFHSYLEDLRSHITSEHPPYQRLGLFDTDGNRHQLNARRLQIENEYYSSVRPKQIPEAGEMPFLALQRRGIRYLELRSIDIAMDAPAGVHLEQIAMLEMLMLFAWLADSPALGQDEIVLCGRNMRASAQSGREPGLQLERPAGNIGVREWGLAIIEALAPLADWLDVEEGTGLYRRALGIQRDKLNDASLTPSAKQMRQIRKHGSFLDAVLVASRAHHRALLADPLDAVKERKFQAEVEKSLACQQRMESETTGTLDEFLQHYFSQLDDPDVSAAAPAASAQ